MMRRIRSLRRLALSVLLIISMVFSQFNIEYAAADNIEDTNSGSKIEDISGIHQVIPNVEGNTPTKDKDNGESNINAKGREKTELIVKYRNSFDEKNNSKIANLRSQVKESLKLQKFESRKRYSKLKMDIMEIGQNDDIQEVVDELKKDPDIEYVQPNYKLEIQSLPQDTRFMEQWGLQNIGQSVEGYPGRPGVDINAVSAWTLTTGSSDVVVGLLDTGVDINHNDLKGNIYVNPNEIPDNGIDDDNNGYVDDINGWDFINADNSVFDSTTMDFHGTQVAGIIAASANSEGVSGAAPNVKLLLMKFINGNWGYTCDAIDAIEYAMSMGVKIVNCSFGGTDNNYALKDTMRNSGLLFVVSGGNRGADVAAAPVYPACFDIPNVLSVASIDSMGVISPYSSYGSKIHVAAPGVNILTTTPDNTYGFCSGTSASAPFVTGAAALLKSYQPNLGFAELASRIKANAVPCTNLTGKVSSGGRVDVYAAITEVKPAEDTYDGLGNDTGTVPGGQQGGNEDTWYTQDQLTKIKAKLHYGESGVNPASGNYSFTSTDLSIPAPGFIINISRTYNSRDDKTIPMGRGWTFGFEGKVNGTDVVEVTLPSGGAQRFRLEGGVYKPEDSRSIFIKNADDTWLLTTKDQYRYTFNAGGYLTKMEDRNGNAVAIEVDGSGKIQKIKDAVNREYVVAYNAQGLISTITAPEDRVVTYGYDSSNRLITITDAMGGIMRYYYDSWGYLNVIKDHYEKIVVEITYNHSEGENQHKVSQAKDALGCMVNYSYDMTNKKTTITDMNGRVSTYWFDSAMYTTRIQDPGGRLEYTEYFAEGGKNKYGDVKHTIDRNGNKTQYEIDDRGNITKLINPDLSAREYKYDDKNNLIEEKDEAGRLTYYIYDGDKKLLLKTVQPLNGTDDYTEASDPSQFAITEYTYYTLAEAQAQFGSNANALLKSVTGPEGNITTYTYDADGNTQTEVNPEGKTVTYAYNRVGQKTEMTTDKGYRTQYVYDKNGLPEKIVLDGGETSRTVYDMVGRVIHEISPNQYDPEMDNLEAHAYNDSSAGYRYTYYDSGIQRTVTDPEGNTTEFTYDVYGNKRTEKRANGSLYRYEYDVLDRLTKVYFKENDAAAEILLYEYSYAIMGDGKTQDTEIKYLNGTEKALIVSIYDYGGRLVEAKYPDGSGEKTAYNPDGSTDRTTSKDGSISYYKYDGMGRLSEQWLPFEVSGGSTRYQYAKYDYDKRSLKTAELRGNEKVLQDERPANFAETYYDYYRDGMLKSVTDNEGRKTEYQYDDDGVLSYQAIYTDGSNVLVTEYVNSHLGKPVEMKKQVREGDIYGNSFSSTAGLVLSTTYSYDKNGNLETVTSPEDVTTTYTYDKLNRQLSMSQLGMDEYGEAVELATSTTYDWEGKPLTKTDARGNVTSCEYSKAGYLVRITDAQDGVAAYEYDRAGRLLAEVSPKNYDPGKSISQMNRIEYVYDLMGRVKTKKDIYLSPDTGQWITANSRSYRYDVSGRVIKELDALGFESGDNSSLDKRILTGYGTEYAYNLAGAAVKILDPESKQRGLSHSVKYEYDALGRKVSETNAKGVIMLYSYDDAGNLLTVSLKKDASAPEKQLKEYTYDLAGRKLSETDANGNTVEYEYTAFGKERKISYPGDNSIDENVITLQYHVNGNLAEKIDSMDRSESYTYDNQGRVLSCTEARSGGSDAITATYRYDMNGNRRFETDGNGTEREIVYDELNRAIETRVTVGGQTKVTAYGYDKNGGQTTVTDWKGNTYTNIYDPLNRLIEKQDPYATVQKLEYNANNLQSKSYDALGNMTMYGYDRNNRLIITLDPKGHANTQYYDDAGNLKTKTDGRGLVTTYNYDEYNRLISVTNALGEVTAYTYDNNGNMLTQTDAKGNSTIYEYNAVNKPVRKIDHGGRLGAPEDYTYISAKVESYTYFADGSLETKEDRNGKTTAYSYDIHGRLLSQNIDVDSIAYTYDNNDNQLTITDATGITEREYDEENRVITKTIPEIGQTVFQYDILEGDGCHSETSTDPIGNMVTKVYDKAGRLLRVEEGENITAYDYYDNGSRRSVTYPDGSKEEYTYYEDGLTETLINTKADGSIIDSYSYTYDAARNQTSKTDAKGTTSYSYDSLNRLQKVTEPSGKVIRYLFDKSGNRIQETAIAGTSSISTTYAYNEQNRLMTTTTRSSGTTEKVTYEYDNNGNTLIKVKETTKPVEEGTTGSFKFYKLGTAEEKEVTFYEYDVWNQLIKTTEGNKAISYQYNGEGYRVEKQVNDEITRYMYEADKVVLELDGQGNETARNIYGTNLLMRMAGAEEYYYMYNGHGDVTALLGTNGTIAAQYYYDAFGNPVAEGTNEGGIDNPIRYAGYQWDGETEIYYLNARYYDPKIARFLTEDTYRGRMSDPLSLNLYAYCKNEPLMYWDPTGHAFTKWDDQHISSAADRAAILKATEDWAKATNDNDRKKAHDTAEAVRDIYRRGTNYVGSDDGTTYSKGDDRDKVHKRLLEGAILSDSDGLYVKKDTDKVNNSKDKSEKARLSNTDVFNVIARGFATSQQQTNGATLRPSQPEYITNANNAVRTNLDLLLHKTVKVWWSGSKVSPYENSVGKIFTDKYNDANKQIYDLEGVHYAGGVALNYYIDRLMKGAGVSKDMRKMLSEEGKRLLNAMLPDPSPSDLIPDLGFLVNQEKIDIAKSKMEYITNTEYKYLIASKSVSSAFIKNVDKYKALVENSNPDIYDTQAENMAYKKAMLDYVDRVKYINMNFEQSIDEMYVELNKIDEYYKSKNKYK